MITLPSKVKQRGENSYLLTVVHEQKEYTKTIKADSKPEAEQEWTLFAADVLKGKALSGDAKKMTLKQFYDYWKEKHANNNYAKTTLATYENAFVRIEASMGHLYLHKIKPSHIVDFLAQLNSPTASNANKPLSARSIAKHRELLSILLSTAYRWDLTVSNPIVKISKPRTERKHKKVPTQEELAKFFDCLNTAPIKNQLMCMLAFTGGLRREEIAGLKWGDFDFQKNTVSIARAATYIPGEPINIDQTKTASSERTLLLPKTTIQLLEAYKTDVKALYARRAKKKKIVILDDPVSSDKWVFSQHDGTIGHPTQMSTFLKRFCEQKNLFNITPHLLRHLHGSYLLKNGLDIAAVSKSLGHTKKSFTLDTYIHTIQTIEEETATVMQNVLNDFKSSKEIK